MKIVKENKVAKLPEAGKSVAEAFRRANIRAQKESWTKVIIIGDGKISSGAVRSKMSAYTVLGMLQVQIAAYIKDMLE